MSERIAPLSNLPLFHKLEGRKAVVVGSSEGAKWKAELLQAAGAKVARLDSWKSDDLEYAATHDALTGLAAGGTVLATMLPASDIGSVAPSGKQPAATMNASATTARVT